MYGRCALYTESQSANLSAKINYSAYVRSSTVCGQHAAQTVKGPCSGRWPQP